MVKEENLELSTLPTRPETKAKAEGKKKPGNKVRQSVVHLHSRL